MPLAVADPVLKRFCAALDERNDGRIERVVLFGSGRRGDDRADSGYDLFVAKFDGMSAELQRRDRNRYPL